MQTYLCSIIFTKLILAFLEQDIRQFINGQITITVRIKHLTKRRQRNKLKLYIKINLCSIDTILGLAPLHENLGFTPAGWL